MCILINEMVMYSNQNKSTYYIFFVAFLLLKSSFDNL